MTGAALGLSSTEGGQSGSTATTVAKAAATPTPISDLTSRPKFAQVVYQVADYSSGTAKTTWEVLTENRPDAETDLTYDSNPFLGGAPSSGTVTTPTTVYSLSSGHLTTVSPSRPGVSNGDQALGSELTDLVGRDLAQSLDQTVEIAGRSCQVFRFASPPNGPLAPLSGSDHDDICVDADGLILSESWTYNSALVVQRTAVEASVTGPDPRIKAAPVTSSAAPAPAGSSDLTEIPGINPASVFVGPPGRPEGYTAMTPVSVTVRKPTKPASVVDASTIWGFGLGGELITVEAGSGQLPWQSGDTPTKPVVLSGLGAAASALESSGPEIRVQLSGGRWVRVDGTVPLPELTAYADSLHLG